LLFLPFRTFEMPSALPPEEIIKRVAAIIETDPPRIPMFYRGNKPCTGMLDGNRFGLQRIIRYRNNFLPIIIGEALPEGNGSRVKIELRLGGGSLGFWIVLIIASLVGAAAIIISSLPRPSQNSLIFAILLPIAVYLLCMIPFNLEADKARKLLNWVTVPPKE
jgi:hypothetical protein